MRTLTLILTICVLSSAVLAAPPKKKKQVENPRTLPELAYRSNSIYSLHEAAAAGDLNTLRQRLSGEVKIDQQDEFGNTALDIATKANQQEAVKLLLKAGASRSAKNN